MLIKGGFELNKIQGESRGNYVYEGIRYAGFYVGRYTYSGEFTINNGVQFDSEKTGFTCNVHLGNYNSIGNNLCLFLSRNHDTTKVSSGALELLAEAAGVLPELKSDFCQKGSVIVQNDVWFGEDVTVMGNVIVRNGAVIAKNSHVVSDVPPYAIVGGNPAKVIGYRFSEEQIEKLQVIQWWYWDTKVALDRISMFDSNIDNFCNIYYPEALEKFQAYKENAMCSNDKYFCFADYYEERPSFPHVIEDFLSAFSREKEKELVLFVQEDIIDDSIAPDAYDSLCSMAKLINGSEGVNCKISVLKGNKSDAKEAFKHCGNYLTLRNWWTVEFTCLADLLGIRIIAGADSKIRFEYKSNMHK